MKIRLRFWNNRNFLASILILAELLVFFVVVALSISMNAEQDSEECRKLVYANLAYARSLVDRMDDYCTPKEMNEALRKVQPLEGAVITEVDSTLMFVVHPDTAILGRASLRSLLAKEGFDPEEEMFEDIRAGIRGYQMFYNTSEEGKVICYERVPGTNNTVILSIPLDSILEGTLLTFLKVIGILVGTFILIVLTNVLILYQLSRSSNSKAHAENELRIANDIQMSMVPKTFPPFPDRSELDIYACLKPAKEVGGDLYDYVLDGDDFYFCIGDVSGKGVPAALVMAITRSLFRNIVKTEKTPAGIANRLNNAIAEGNEKNMFVTMVIGTFNLKTGEFSICNCGHNLPATNASVIDPKTMSIGPTTKGRFMSQLQTNMPIGVFAGFDYKQISMKLTHGCNILLYTDGITEAENRKKNLFGDERLIDAISQLPIGSSAETIVKSLLSKLQEFTDGAEQSDDITVVCFRYN